MAKHAADGPSDQAPEQSSDQASEQAPEQTPEQPPSQDAPTRVPVAERLQDEPTPLAERDARESLTSGATTLGIEFGSTRIKACLIDENHAVLAVGAHDWENQFSDRRWTYSEAAIWGGLADAVANLLSDAEQRHGVRPSVVGSIGISAMMHGYLPFDAAGNLLVPFRTWRNTTTGPASEQLTEALAYTIPLRWSVAHFYQAILDGEPHVSDVAFLTSLAGYVHWKLTGEKVIGVGDASGLFPVDVATRNYDGDRLARFDALASQHLPGVRLKSLLPGVLQAGEVAGHLTPEGAALLDPTGTLVPGIPLCPPEGDAGTGMVATNAVAPRTGNVSVGTSIFAMIVLERPLARMHPEIDLVTTPAGDLVAMVHCNNGASELGEWVAMFGEFAGALGVAPGPDVAFGAFLRAALDGDADAGGLLAYNYLAGEPVTGLAEGRPLFVRTPDSTFSLANFARAQVYGVFGTLSLGMELLDGEGVEVDALFAHGGVFRTAGVAQRMLAAAVDSPIAVAETASEGGAWGIAVLAAYQRSLAALSEGTELSLGEYLTQRVFADATLAVVEPDPADVAGYGRFLERYRAGIAVERAAAEAI